ncbi:MAG: type IV pilus twitching motility protein PilT [Synergistaceae bacterium]|nr:type IV pilus twitching motility protein PilT [Synergistaceae bacterium]
MALELSPLLAEVIKRGASDLHIGEGIKPTIRIDGGLVQISEKVLNKEDIERMFSEVLSEAQYENYMKNHEIDYSFSFEYEELSARFRGNCYFESKKKAGAFRLIPSKIRSIDELDLPKILKDISQRRRGLFLVTGPTGHGKSTTLAALINEVNCTRKEHILTIEDPIEYVYKSESCLVHQREIGTDTNSFSEALRRALRQDPDVILIGEMRDLETIAFAITAAETGHFVLGTLHTQDASQSIDRIIDVFPSHQQQQVRTQLGTVLVGICSQQLVPRDGGGRVCATEILIANPAVRNCIKEAKTSQIKSLIQTGNNIGMHTMEQSLAKFVRACEITRETAEVFAYDPKDLDRLLEGY